MIKKACTALLLSLLFAVRAPAQNRPNIVLILTDDLDALLGTLDYTPNINHVLRDAGMSFANAYVTNSVCCPSRSTLLRSQYTHSHQVYTNYPPIVGYPKFQALALEKSTLAVWLRDAGYATALMGKYLNGYRGTHVPPGWTDWRAAAAGNIYGSFNYSLNENGVLHEYGSAPSDYMTDVLAHHAQNFIHEAVAARQPFFLELATFAPHQPATPAPRHAALFGDLQNPGGAHEFDELYRKRVRAMQGVDELVKQLTDSLSRLGQLDNTFIIFTSDNGFHLGQHGLKAGKQTAYDEDIRVPLFIRGPGITPGSRNDQLVANVDLAPTIAEMASARTPDFVEGRSLLPLLHGRRVEPWRSAVLIESYAGNRRDGARMPRRIRTNLAEQQPAYVALRTTDYLYVERRNGARELYDLRRDPHETDNIAPAALQMVQTLSQRAAALHSCSGANCRELEQ